MSNPCIRCGKERLSGKTWQDKIGSSVITYTLTVCPDRQCQKILDQDMADRKARSEALIKQKLEAKRAREKPVVTT